MSGYALYNHLALCDSYFMLFGVDFSCRTSYSIVSYLNARLYVSCSGSITSVGEETANLSAIVYL